MKYLRTYNANNWPKKETLSDKLVRLVFSFVPTANPRYLQQYHLLDEWLIEFNEDGDIKRELALNKEGKVIFANPYKNNLGFWLDSKMKFKDFENKKVTEEKFNKLWNDFFLNKK